MPYRSPVSEFQFLLRNVIDYGAIAATERFAHADLATVDAVLSEAGSLAQEVLAPLQRTGDSHPAVLENGVVRSSPGFAEGYKAVAKGGWVATSAPSSHGGMDLPLTVTTALNEMMSGACVALQLNALMTQGQIAALHQHANDSLKDLYLPKLISGEWSGTMNLTEPQAGSDVGALRAKAEAKGDGTYAVTGQKIYISWGDTDFTENVCHLVLARLPGGAEGTKGISLFLVPKYLPDADGRPGPANALKVISLEHKMGMHGSPTAVMQYDGATGWLIGEEHDGMAAMFTMMNNARLGVGVQGIGVAEAAFQHAMAHALERRQGKSIHGYSIAAHADVRRMLMTMKSEIFAARCIALACAAAIDRAAVSGDAAWAKRAGFLTPIAKAFGTETGVSVADTGIQIHGGMGFVEETGAAQFFRDVRVTAIYEGTNGIQAMDLIGRKLADEGETAQRLLDESVEVAERARASHPDLAGALWQASESLREATEWLVAQGSRDDRSAGGAPYLRAFARLLGAGFHLRAACADPGGPGNPREVLARFYIERLLPENAGLLAHAMSGADGLYAMSLDDLCA